jgi:hypothetical protein
MGGTGEMGGGGAVVVSSPEMLGDLLRVGRADDGRTAAREGDAFISGGRGEIQKVLCIFFFTSSAFSASLAPSSDRLLRLLLLFHAAGFVELVLRLLLLPGETLTCEGDVTGKAIGYIATADWC